MDSSSEITRWWTRDEANGTIVLVEDGLKVANVAEIPDPWADTPALAEL